MADDEDEHEDLDTHEQSGINAADRTAGELSGEISEARVPKPGEKVGRYMVLERVGAGGMGVVLAAYDPELERKVALKLLRAGGGNSSLARQRLVREAQALARLSHRNVVAVHDVGVHDGDVFIAMEFVKGQTLGQWMTSEEGPRPWQEVLRTFVEAGRGLAAAHRAGLVHRDFKPDNVMLDEHGRVVVMDFGLARADESDERDETLEESIPESSLAGRLTRRDSLVGTPIYMSPEQLVARPADSRSDQFSFCASLYEALYGERPFAGKSVPELWQATTESMIRPVPRRSSVPGWVRAAVVRGLAARPGDRWPSMEALLEALEADPRARRRRWLVAGGLCAALVGATWGAVSLADREPELDRTCVGLERHLEGVWDDERRAQVRAAIEATELSYADATWERVERLLDNYGQKWVEARTEACEATQSGEQSATLLDRRMACLDRRLMALRAQVEVLAAADSTIVERAVSAVSKLPRLERCADAEALMAEVAPPEDPAIAKRVDALSAELARAHALEESGKYEEGLAIATKVVEQARAVDHEPLRVRARLRLGQLQYLTGDLEGGRKSLEIAYDGALGLRMIDEASKAANRLVYVVGYLLENHDEGQRWVMDADPLSRAAGDPLERASYFNNLGSLESAMGNYADSRIHTEQSLEILERQLDEDDPSVAMLLHNLGRAANDLGEYDAAREACARAMTIDQRVLDKDHPVVASDMRCLGDAAVNQSQYEVARGYYQRALEIAIGALGVEHAQVSALHNELGNTLLELAMHEEAQDHLERALEIDRKLLEPDHPYIADDLHNLAVLNYERGRLESALENLENALAIQERSLGAEHPDLALTLSNLAALADMMGHHAVALDHANRALEIAQRRLHDDHPHVGDATIAMGRALLELGRAAEAIAHLERSLTIRVASGDDPVRIATARFLLARALWETPKGRGRDRKRALELARLALADVEQAGEVAAENRVEIEEWLASVAKSE